jgi:hypothetical protein
VRSRPTRLFGTSAYCPNAQLEYIDFAEISTPLDALASNPYAKLIE